MAASEKAIEAAYAVLEFSFEEGTTAENKSAVEVAIDAASAIDGDERFNEGLDAAIECHRERIQSLRQEIRRQLDYVDVCQHLGQQISAYETAISALEKLKKVTP